MPQQSLSSNSRLKFFSTLLFDWRALDELITLDSGKFTTNEINPYLFVDKKDGREGNKEVGNLRYRNLEDDADFSVQRKCGLSIKEGIDLLFGLFHGAKIRYLLAFSSKKVDLNKLYL